MMRSAVILIVLANVHDGNCVQAEVTLQPDPVNTTFGSIVNFKCNAVGDIVSWKVNGLSSKDPTIGETFEADVDTTPTGSNTYRSALNLRANREGITRIQCVAVSFFNVSDFSQEVTLLVQGLLDPPSNTEHVGPYNSSHQLITWTAPYTIDITHLDPDITYCVCDNYTNTCVNVIDTFHVFSTANMNPSIACNVSACNPFGCSASSKITIVLVTSHYTEEGILVTSATSSALIRSSPKVDVAISNEEQEKNLEILIITGAGIGVFVLVTTVMVILTVFIAAYIYRRKRRSCPGSDLQETAGDNVNANIPTKRNSAYVSHQLRRQKIKVHHCPAYDYIARHGET